MFRSLQNSPILFPSKYTNESYWGVRPARKADNLTTICELIGENMGASTSHNPMGLHGLLQRELYLFYRFTVFQALEEQRTTKDFSKVNGDSCQDI
jgi:hypothetical protein